MLITIFDFRSFSKHCLISDVKVNVELTSGNFLKHLKYYYEQIQKKLKCNYLLDLEAVGAARLLSRCSAKNIERDC